MRYGVGVGVIAGIIVLDGLCRLVLIVCVWLVLIDCCWFGVWGLSWCVVSCFYRFVCGFWLDLIQAGVLIRVWWFVGMRCWVLDCFVVVVLVAIAMVVYF